MNKIIFLLLFSILASHIAAQPALTGKVMDENGKGLAAVSVFIPEL